LRKIVSRLPYRIIPTQYTMLVMLVAYQVLVGKLVQSALIGPILEKFYFSRVTKILRSRLLAPRISHTEYGFKQFYVNVKSLRTVLQ
jgi:hypothetical protein